MISFSKIADDYYSLVTDFYKWFFERLQAEHKEDFDRLQEMIKRVNTITEIDKPDDRKDK